jgi:hypothetical protein
MKNTTRSTDAARPRDDAARVAEIRRLLDGSIFACPRPLRVTDASQGGEPMVVQTEEEVDVLEDSTVTLEVAEAAGPGAGPEFAISLNDWRDHRRAATTAKMLTRLQDDLTWLLGQVERQQQNLATSR